jgi:uncharacterized protein
VIEETHLKDQLEQLVRLQEIDNRVVILRSEATRIPEKIETARKSLVETQEQYSQSRVEWESGQQRKREKERDLEACEDRLSKVRNRQNEVKTNKEYQAHLLEIESLKVEKGRVEEELLLLMEQMDVCKRRETELAQTVQSVEQKFKTEQQQLEKQSEVLKAELGVVEKERESISPGIDPMLLKKYQKIKSLHREWAVVPIRHGTCGGCHMNVPPQMIAEVRARQRILTCSQCQRILYWPSSAEQAAVINEAGSPQAPAASS